MVEKTRAPCEKRAKLSSKLNDKVFTNIIGSDRPNLGNEMDCDPEAGSLVHLVS